MHASLRPGVQHLSPVWEPTGRQPLEKSRGERSELGIESSAFEDASRGADVNASQADKLVVLACGHTLSVDSRKVCTLADLKAHLEATFHSEGQAFTIFDRTGASVTTDAQVQRAVEEGLLPFAATLQGEVAAKGSDLSQIHWRLLHEQVQSATDKTASLERQVSSLHQEMERCRQMQQKLAESLQEGAAGHLASCEPKPPAEVTTASEQMQAVGNQLQWLRDVFEQLKVEKLVQREEQMAVLKEIRAELDLERRTREALEGQCAACTRALEEQLQSATTYHGDMLREHVEAFKIVTHEGLQQLTQEVLQLRSKMEGVSSQVNTRIADMQERCVSMESVVLEGKTHEGKVHEARPEGVSVDHDRPRKQTSERKEREPEEPRIQAPWPWAAIPGPLAAGTACAASAPWIASGKQQAGHGVGSPLRSRPAGSLVESPGGSSPLRLRPGPAPMDTSGGASPLRMRPGMAPMDGSGGTSPLRTRPIEAPAIFAAAPGNSPLRPRQFAVGAKPFGTGTPVGTACIAGALATPRGTPAAPVGTAPGQPRGRPLGSTPSIACASPPGAVEARKQSFSPVRQMLLFKQQPFGAGVGTGSAHMTRS